jgi:hypothetical protein
MVRAATEARARAATRERARAKKTVRVIHNP